MGIRMNVAKVLLVSVAVSCLIVGLGTLPVLPGLLNWQSVGESKSPYLLPAQTLAFVSTSQGGSESEEYFFNVTVALSFPDGGTFSVGNSMLMNVSMKLPENILPVFSFGLIDVLADGAVWYGSYSNSLPPPIATEFPSSNNISCMQASNSSFTFSPNYVRFLLPNEGSVYDPNSGEWVELRTGAALLDYPAPGQFDLGVSIYQANGTKNGEHYCGFTLRTAPFIKVLSQETVDTQRNNAYTLSLALFVLTFAAIQVYVEIKPQAIEGSSSVEIQKPTPSKNKERKKPNERPTTNR